MSTLIRALPSKLTYDPNALVRFNYVKIYVDSILSLGTTALYNDYLDLIDLPARGE